MYATTVTIGLLATPTTWKAAPIFRTTRLSLTTYTGYTSMVTTPTPTHLYGEDCSFLDDEFLDPKELGATCPLVYGP